MADAVAVHGIPHDLVHALQCYTYMVAFDAQTLFLTCLTYTWALRHSEDEPGVLYVSEVRCVSRFWFD